MRQKDSDILLEYSPDSNIGKTVGNCYVMDDNGIDGFRTDCHGSQTIQKGDVVIQIPNAEHEYFIPFLSAIGEFMFIVGIVDDIDDRVIFTTELKNVSAIGNVTVYEDDDETFISDKNDGCDGILEIGNLRIECIQENEFSWEFHPHGELPERAGERIGKFILAGRVMEAASDIFLTYDTDESLIYYITEDSEKLILKRLMRYDEDYLPAWFYNTELALVAETLTNYADERYVVKPSENVFSGILRGYIMSTFFEDWDPYSIYDYPDDGSDDGAPERALAHVDKFTQLYQDIFPGAFALYESGVLMEDIFA